MSRHAVIRLTYQNKYPGKKPGEMGFSTSSIIDFLDLDGKMAALNEQETAVKDHVLKLLSGPPDSIRLRMSMRTKSGKSFAIETQSHAQQLAESMKRAEKVSFIVLKST